MFASALNTIRGNLRNFPSAQPEVGTQMSLPPEQPDIKQAAKLLSDFIESCPGGDSYLITPDGENLETDWGYVAEGIQLIHDWAERRTDETD